MDKTFQVVSLIQTLLTDKPWTELTDQQPTHHIVTKTSCVTLPVLIIIALCKQKVRFVRY